MACELQIGIKRNMLTLVEKLPNQKYRCVCDCGNICFIQSSKFGRDKSCGCLKHIKNKGLDMVGQRFGRLVVLERDYTVRSKRAYWISQCDCGNKVTSLGKDLRSGKIRSCKCLFLETSYQKAITLLKPFNSLLTDDGPLKRNHDPNYCKWVKKVYRNYEKTCANCGSKKLIEAHHINNFRDHPNQALSEDNGICLCKNCHRNFHKEYGNRNTNMSKLVNFLFK